MTSTRRAFLGGMLGAGAAVLSASPRAWGRVAPALPVSAPPRDFTFTAAERPTRLLDAPARDSALWTYTDAPFPVIRVRQNERIRAQLINHLPEHTSMHWHGIRLPSNMDGVPYLSQPPVLPGQSFTYDFAPPDTGTFFFHPHCNEPGQLGRGMLGALIVEGDETAPYDDELVLTLKDWRLAPDGAWLPFDTSEGAGRAGTFGTVRGVNGARPFTGTVPAKADVRLRLLNLDSSRVIEVGVEGAEAWVIAIDGHGVKPFALHTWRMGPAMRLDIAVRTPEAGGQLQLLDYFSATPWPMATLTAEGKNRRMGDFKAHPLKGTATPQADLKNAQRLPFTFSAASGGVTAAEVLGGLSPDDPFAKVLLDSLCIGGQTLWAINKASWPDDGHRTLPPPLAELRAGESYIFTLTNVTPHPHPIHLHGHVFEVLSASRQKLPRFHADTVLLLPKETIEIAFVAELGNWMFHCHVVEHLHHGMMGWVRVT